MTKEIGQNIFKDEIRFDLQIIASLIKENSSVLDIGCGDGELLQYLSQNKNCQAKGIEISGHKVSKSLLKGLSVIQGNAEEDLLSYPDNSFDYAILSQTIQATHKPDKVLSEMLRISKKAIVALPNFANIKNRLHLFFKGTMPVNKTIPFQWYETPNIHFCSVKDFQNLCYELNFAIQNEIYLTNNRKINSKFIANLFSEYAIFLIEKDELSAVKEAEFTKEAQKYLQKNMKLQTY